MTLGQQLLCPGIGGDLATAPTAPPWRGAIGNHGGSLATPIIPGASDATGHLPDPAAATAGPRFCFKVGRSITAIQILTVGKGLARQDHRQIDVAAAEHLRDAAAIAIRGPHLKDDGLSNRQALLQNPPRLLPVRLLGRLRCIDAGQANGQQGRIPPDTDRVTIADRHHHGPQGFCRGWVCPRQDSDRQQQPTPVHGSSLPQWLMPRGPCHAPGAMAMTQARSMWSAREAGARVVEDSA